MNLDSKIEIISKRYFRNDAINIGYPFRSHIYDRNSPLEGEFFLSKKIIDLLNHESTYIVDSTIFELNKTGECLLMPNEPLKLKQLEQCAGFYEIYIYQINPLKNGGVYITGYIGESILQLF